MSNLPVNPSLDDFRGLARKGNVVPVYAQLAADFETPLSAYVKISGDGEAFLFESAESAGDSGRYSILGSNPRAVIKAEGHQITHTDGDESRTWTAENDILAELEQLMDKYQSVSHGNAPPFYGGAVGYLSYDAVRQFEPSIGPANKDELGLPDALFIIADTLLIFDHLLRRILVVANAFVDEFENSSIAYQDACDRIERMINQLDTELHIPPLNGLATYETPEANSNTTQQEYEEMVVKAKEYIAAGDAFQIVPSQRFETDFSGSPVDLYRALRHINPSPYMFILELEDFALVGSSPEVHVRAIDGRIDIRPIAGTRWRGKTKEEDDALAADLLADEKECAEHLMLVDLARNDVGRISKHGSVKVDDFMIVERYSHVMHIVSNVHGDLDDDYSAYDVLRATFPAGTVSGAPKIRAMQIINELEKSKRCSYSGAVGYFGWDGGHDSCITLRTCLIKDGKAYVQAGAGVVADSNPTYEYEETVNKSMAIIRAIGLAKTLTPDS
ncbi:MAG: anthranilate synthase component I [Verrucomicrobiae bacterium]|nr:anthranilate synthase component I [Verrucomicrobiae bacterium]NNJ86547.1 anthranilate synthase component I [Akkermansiaceae bacterium]